MDIKRDQRNNVSSFDTLTFSGYETLDELLHQLDMHLTKHEQGLDLIDEESMTQQKEEAQTMCAKLDESGDVFSSRTSKVLKYKSRTALYQIREEIGERMHQLELHSMNLERKILEDLAKDSRKSSPEKKPKLAPANLHGFVADMPVEGF